MEHGVAHAGDERTAQQHRIVLGAGQQQRGNPKQRQPAHQHAGGADAVDHEAGQRLADAGDDEEHRHQQAKFGIRETESRFQPREHRGQNQVIEVGNAVGKGNEPDDARVLPQ